MPHYADYDPATTTLTFIRRLGKPPAAVWSALTEKDQLDHWFPSPLSASIGPGEELTFNFPGHDFGPLGGTVSEFDPPRLLVFSWGPDLLRFELEPAAGGGTVLTFTVNLESSDKAARDGAGWHQCLDRLVRQIGSGDGTAPTMEMTPEWREYYEEYQRRGLPAIAELPE